MQQNNKQLAGLLALSLAAAISTASAAKPGFEKCLGVAKAGMNDCGNSAHSCAGQARQDADADEWIYVPEGTCEKIVGGSVEASNES